MSEVSDGGGVSERSSRARDRARVATGDFQIAFSRAPRSRSRSCRCRPLEWWTLDNPAPRRQWTARGDFFSAGSKSGWGLRGCQGFTFAHCHCLFVGGQDPGEQGAKAPCSPLSLHCRIVDFPLSIFHCRFSVVVPTGGSCLVRVVRVVAVVPVVTVVRVVAVVAIVDFASSCLPAEVVWRGW